MKTFWLQSENIIKDLMLRLEGSASVALLTAESEKLWLKFNMTPSQSLDNSIVSRWDVNSVCHQRQCRCLRDHS